MNASETVWVYRVAGEPYMIAKRHPFSDYTRSMDYRSGQLSYTLVQGVQMTIPSAWEWKQKHAGRTFAGFAGHVYDITDLERVYFVPPK
jgi:hypothetical protein